MFRLPQGVTARRRTGDQRAGDAGADEKFAPVDAVLAAMLDLPPRRYRVRVHNLIFIIALLYFPARYFSTNARAGSSSAASNTPPSSPSR